MTYSEERIETPAGPALLKRSNRKTLGISVLPDGRLELAAPTGATVEAICGKVGKRLGWIDRQRKEFAVMNALRPARRYVTGATHRYLGKQYRLRIQQGSSSSVKLRNGWLHVTVCETGEESIKAALEGWFRARAKEQFQRRVEQWKPWCRHRGLPVPSVKIQRMARRWGSALTSGQIRLNPELIHAPSICIDYVIAHEICHLKHPNHGREFQLLLKQLMPGWEAIKHRLETEM